jgi:dTDP-4-dehydrorhamnose 3,5-epimerase
MGIADVAVLAPLTTDDFTPDTPFEPRPVATPVQGLDLIEGVTVTPLTPNADERGSLVELLTTRDGPIEPIVHVYQVTSLAGSCRAWVYHRLQYDRLAFAQGRFLVVLYDIREESPTRHKLNVFEFGSARPSLLRIPPFVVHGVKNIGSETSIFLNMPTKVYLPSAPDKSRLPANDPRIPFSF